MNLSQWQGEQDTLEPVDIDDAVLLYEVCPASTAPNTKLSVSDVEVDA